MPSNYFITGNPKAGKTTLLKQLVKELKKKGLKVGGFVSPDERHHGTRTAFRVMDLESGKSAMLASVKGDGPKISKYHVDIQSFESIALPAMTRSGSYDVMVIDEIGVMELKSGKFADMLDDLLESETPLIATLHHGLVDKFVTSGQVIEVDEENRSQVLQKLLRDTSSIAKKAPAKAKGLPAKAKPAAKKEKPAKKAVKKKPVKMAPPAKAPEGKAREEKAEEPAAKPEHKKEEKKGGLINRIKKLFGS